MKRTIIYVFTPKRLQRDYQSRLRLPDFPLGWIKIGKTSSDNDDEDKWDVAYNRIKQEVRTGISETCVLVDVFEYPEISGSPKSISTISGFISLAFSTASLPFTASPIISKSG